MPSVCLDRGRGLWFAGSAFIEVPESDQWLLPRRLFSVASHSSLSFSAAAFSRSHWSPSNRRPPRISARPRRVPTFVVKRSGETVTDAQLQQLQNVLFRWQSRFYRETGGRARANLTLDGGCSYTLSASSIRRRPQQPPATSACLPTTPAPGLRRAMIPSSPSPRAEAAPRTER